MITAPSINTTVSPSLEMWDCRTTYSTSPSAPSTLSLGFQYKTVGCWWGQGHLWQGWGVGCVRYAHYLLVPFYLRTKYRTQQGEGNPFSSIFSPEISMWWGCLTTTTTPPSCQTQDRGVLPPPPSFPLAFWHSRGFQPPPPLPCIKTQERGVPSPLPPLPHIKMQEGGVLSPMPPLLSCFNVTGCLTTTTTPSSCRNTRGRVLPFYHPSATLSSHVLMWQGCLTTTAPLPSLISRDRGGGSLKLNKIKK